MANPKHDESGKFTSKEEPPLVDVKVTNPITYLKLWWQKIVGNEGIEFKLKIRPLTALTIVAVLALGGYGLARLSALLAETPLVKYIPVETASPTPDPVKYNAGYTGIVLYSDTLKKFYLETPLSGTLTLVVPDNINLMKLVGKRIFAVGNYNIETSVLSVFEATDIEILPSTPALPPTSTPTPVPSTTPTSTSIPTPTVTINSE